MKHLLQFKLEFMQKETQKRNRSVDVIKDVAGEGQHKLELDLQLEKVTKAYGTKQDFLI